MNVRAEANSRSLRAYEPDTTTKATRACPARLRRRGEFLLKCFKTLHIRKRSKTLECVGGGGGEGWSKYNVEPKKMAASSTRAR